MKRIPLKLRHSKSSAKPSGWYLPGNDAESWLEELTRWDIPLAKIDLYFLPRSTQNREPGGLFVTFPDELKTRLRAQPYQCLCDKLYIPVNAVFL